MILSLFVLISLYAGNAFAAQVWVPAVSGTLSGLMSNGTDYALNSLAGTVVYPNTTEWNTDNHTQADGVTYTVSIPAAGTWYLWSRMYYPGTTPQPTNDPNSFWVSIDGGSAAVLGNRTDVDRTWHWEGAAGSLLSLGNVSAGNHTLRVWNREARETAASKLSPRLDVLLLTNEAGYIPNDVDAAKGLNPSPTVSTNAATSITTGGGTLNGGVNPNGQATTVWFEWGTSPTLSTFSVTPNQSLGSGTTSQAVSAAVSGLSPGTTYYFRAAASNASGTVKGSILSFGTSAVAPTATTSAATSVTSGGGTLNGGVNPNGQATTAWFEWGTSPTLSTFSVTPNQSVGSGMTSQAVSAAVSGLSPGTTYYFRVAASNATETVKGSIASFSTGAAPPAVTTNAATSIATTRVFLNGSVNPNGQATIAWFEWGTSPTLATFSVTANQSLGSGTTTQSIPTALSGLNPGTTYYFRTAASNASGTVKGSILNSSTIPISGFNWGTATPESQGLNTTKLDLMWDTLQTRSTAAFLVIRNDKIVYEKYVSLSRHENHYTASLVKGLVGGISLMVAMSDGLISPDEPATKYVPQWASDPAKSKITVRELATHTSGLDEAGEVNVPKDQLTGWKGDFWKRLPEPDDPFTLSRDYDPVIFSPGTAMLYSNPGYAMLGYAVTAALKGTADQDLRSLLYYRIMNPIGVPSTEWDCGYGETYTVDGLPLVPSWGGGSYSPDAIARVGRLVLRQGDWDGRQLISPGVVQAATYSHPGLPGNGLGWWGNLDNTGKQLSPSLPMDAFYANPGAGHQVLLVIPSLNLIMVRSGETLDSGDFDLAMENYLFGPLMAAIIQAAATTNAATSITATGATLNGGVNPKGQMTTAWFEWGTDPTLATFSTTSNQSLGSGTTSQAVTTTLTGLSSGATYYFRAAASNAGGTVKGSIFSFGTSAVAPTATTSAATSVTSGGGTLNGGVNPNGISTTVWFEWGTDPTLATFSTTSNQSLGSGTTSQAVSAAVSGLSPGTTYYFRAAASNAGGTVRGSILSFTTTIPLLPPTVSTSAAMSVTSGGGTLNGGVNPNGQATTAWFEWGTSPTLATFSVTPNQSVGSGMTSQAVSAAISGLSPGTTYYFRVAASNATGTTKGSIASFGTPVALAPTAVTNAATFVTASGATLNGGVNPNGISTTAWFEWGTSPTLATFSVTSNQSRGSGTTSQAITAVLSGLTSGTTYYFRVAASNTGGTVKGSIRSFTTTVSSQAPRVTTNAATSVTSGGATLNGSVNPNRRSTTAWFEWGTDPILVTFSVTPNQSLGSGNTSRSMSAAVSGLTSGTTYYFRVAASNSAGIVKGSIRSFTAISPLLAPNASTNPANSITFNSATVNGGVNPNGVATSAWFEWGTSPTLAAFSATSNQSLGSGTTSQAVSAALSGLSSGTTYYFRVAASNASGTMKGSILSFGTTTAMVPTVTTTAATTVTYSGATVNGGVNPNGQATTAWFEWGTDPTLATFSTTTNQSMGSGTTVIPFSESISGLSSYGTFYFRAVGSNSVGTQKGAIRSFTTGKDYVAVGDSITGGSHDGISEDGFGFEPILSDLLTVSMGPNTIANEGVSGTSSADGAASISATLSKYPSAKYYLVMYGSNDAKIPAVPSGMGLIPGDAGYSGSYKDNMQKLISAILAAGKTTYLAEVPYTSDPLRSNAMINEYNAVVDELFLTNDILVTPPPFYAYFQTHLGELADGLHPNGTGYRSMANLWFSALTK